MTPNKSASNKTAWATGELKEEKGREGDEIKHSSIHRKHVQLENLHAISLQNKEYFTALLSTSEAFGNDTW